MFVCFTSSTQTPDPENSGRRAGLGNSNNKRKCSQCDGFFSCVFFSGYSSWCNGEIVCISTTEAACVVVLQVLQNCVCLMNMVIYSTVTQCAVGQGGQAHARDVEFGHKQERLTYIQGTPVASTCE